MFSVHERLIISSHCGIFPSLYMVERMSDRLFSMEKGTPAEGDALLSISRVTHGEA